MCMCMCNNIIHIYGLRTVNTYNYTLILCIGDLYGCTVYQILIILSSYYPLLPPILLLYYILSFS